MPETSDGKKFDYTKLGMMKAKMHQQRLDKNKKKMGGKDYNERDMQKEFAIGMGATAAGVGAMGTGLVLSTAGETRAEKEARLRFNNRVANMDKSRVKASLSGGGGGGIYNVAQPVADKNIMNKYGKKLK
ncbi:hypothetical protein [uncultured Mediterranean phage uvMED]|nr:hypothetical protein [uncultured Mediterranean phage uvMED]BAQ87009.1 hypothetical protein [uncultured Mediterranean phage uvMED]BAQ87065.1 hypothetical protein [uncultured Mediterranean phage uvMED]BAR16627.1 hypothetical protein [uncultured Mediterranean phage uvMED]BAR16646.1 hypothetical protein [uncultured Mediterranean phage uvMED]